MVTLSVSFNCLACIVDQPVGVERFVRNVVGGVRLGPKQVRCITRNSVTCLDLLLTQEFANAHPDLMQTQLPVGRTIPRILTEMFLLPFFTRNDDVVLSVNNFGPIWGKRDQRRLLVIHDVWFMDPGYEGSYTARRIFNWLIRLMIKRSSLVVTVSEFSQREIARWFDIERSEIEVVENCLGTAIEPVARKAMQDPPYLLLMGSSRRNKNVLRAVDGFRRYRAQYPDSSLQLKIAGRFPDTFIESLGNADELEADNISFTGYVSDIALNSLYGQSSGVIFPSLYEAGTKCLLGRQVPLHSTT